MSITKTNSNTSLSSQACKDFLDKRKEALSIFDEADVNTSHTRVCLVASAGFFTDGYTIYVISFVLKMLDVVYGKDKDVNTAPTHFMIKSSFRFGAILGHLLFGYLADKYGRKKMFGVELIIVIIGTLFSAMAGESSTISFVANFVICRVIVGIGIGGDYPISALIISEHAPRRFRGRMLAAGYAFFALGMLWAGVSAVAVLAAFHNSVDQDQPNLVLKSNFDHVWRIIIGFGAIPAIIALFFRLSIPETPRYLIHVGREIEWARNIEPSRIGDYDDQIKSKQPQNTNHFLDMYRHFRSGESGKYLIVTSIIWFCANISSTGYRADCLLNGFSNLYHNNSVYNTKIVDNLNGPVYYHTIMSDNLNSVVRLFLGYLPGALLTVCLIDRWGRKPILYTGFIACAVLFALLGVLIKPITQIDHSNNQTLLGLLYYSVSTVTIFFTTFGPHAVAFVVSSELFPTRYRSTAYGISASFGKVSVILSFLIFEWLYDVKDNFRDRFPVATIVYAICMIIGAAATTFLPETNNKPLEEIADDDELTSELEEKPFVSPNAINHKSMDV